MGTNPKLPTPPVLSIGVVRVALRPDDGDIQDFAQQAGELETAQAGNDLTNENPHFSITLNDGSPLEQSIVTFNFREPLPSEAELFLAQSEFGNEKIRSIARTKVTDEPARELEVLVGTIESESDRQKRGNKAYSRAVQNANDKKRSLRLASDKKTRGAVTKRGGNGTSYLSTTVRYSQFASVEDILNQSKQISNRPDITGTSVELNNGIQSRPNRRPSLQVVPSPSSGGVVITDFYVTDIREEDSEKFQIVETFGTNFIFFFGRKPRIYVVSGILVNSLDRDWKNKFKQTYDTTLRGTQLTKNRQRAIFSYEDVVREGYLLNFSYSHNSQNPHSIPFSFSFFVTREAKVTDV